MTNISKDKLEVAGKVLEPIGNFMSKTIHLIKQWKGLVVFSNINKMHNEAHKWMTNITSKGGIYSNPNIPQDLAEKNPRTILTADGKPVAGQVLISDYNFGEDAGIAELYLGLIVFGMIVLNIFGITKSISFDNLLAVGKFAGGLAAIIIVSSIFTKQFKSLISVILFIVYIVLIYFIINFQTESLLLSIVAYSIPSLLIFFVSYNKDKKRALELTVQSQSHSNTLNEEHITEFSDNPKAVQIINAMADKSPFIEIGESTGRFFKNGDSHAPVKGVTMGLTTNDLSQHFLSLGKSGTGKSYILRALVGQMYIHSILEESKIGMLIICGKGVLPYDLEPAIDLIIDPKNVKRFNPLNGIKPQQLTRIILAANGVKLSEAGPNLIFTGGGQEAMYFTFVLREVLLKMKDIAKLHNFEVRGSITYTTKLATIFLSKGKFKDNVLVSHPILDILQKHPDYENDEVIKLLVDYIFKIQTDNDNEILQSYLANFNIWMSPFTQNTDFIPWNNSDESDINIPDIYQGKKFGVPLSNEAYGEAGKLYTQLIKAIAFNAGALRDDDWAKDKNECGVLMVIDECQDIVSDDDVIQSQKGRSRGIKLIYSTQSYTNLVNKLGNEDTARALINSFSNYLLLKTEDKKSTQFFEESLGKIRITNSRIKTGNPIDFNHTNRELMKSIEFDNSHEEAHYIKFNGAKTKTTNLKFTSRSKYEKGGYSNDINDEGAYATYQAYDESPERDLFSNSDQKALEIPRYALLKVQRAGLLRADIVKVIGWSKETLKQNIEEAKLEVQKRYK